MSYRRFDTDDLVVSADSITTPAWTNNVTTLTTFFTSSTQTATNAGKYYYHIYDTGSAAGEIQFAVAYGHRKGSGSALFNSGEDGKSYSSAVYGQFRTLITGDEDTDFTFTSASTSYTPDNLYFISVQRSRFREKILPGTMDLKFTNGSNNLHLTDNSKVVSTDTFVDAGRQYSLYSGSLGAIDNTTIEYGKLYPDVGIIALDANALSKHGFVSTINSSSNHTGTDNKNLIFNSLKTGAYFKLRADETLSSNFIFVRARNSEFNYSTNPSNITGSGELRHSVMIDNPQSYITQVGLYNDNNDLLAVAKLSTPLLKDFTKEALVRIKLDF